MHYLPSRFSPKAILPGWALALVMAVLYVLPSCSTTSNLPPAQTTVDFYQKYKNEAGFKGTTLPVGLVTRYLLPKDADTTVRAALANITSMRVLSFTPTNRKAQRLLDHGLTQELDQVLTKENYENLPVVLDNPGALQFRMRTAQEQVQEIVGYRKYGNSFLMLQINGRFTRRQVEQMLQKIDPEIFLPLLG
ncbi:hypothetical protein TH63_16255 [Rufibacter radiotolerans]|uniref:DUF4252 domain-containing protein n=1 Tax=Rufibacter radiotolerans TaxID=1379910 RepID=A0A0H4VNE0_9BACT|nr:DUF4252 domain-containing protein [Rufibacter radiotolerans]AKQ46828.1 hypothetical protein TH63_16255 [Rufibacter radiotolerans]